ncbi:hypothetical protein MKX01_012969 [Papaver californicum]|nr:hypothetical protein MKX01_012969 [Papaver californicum]
MGISIEEEEIWKCKKHPTKKRIVSGVCPSCLRDRLNNLCPNCACELPCVHCTPLSTSSSSSSSSSGFASDGVGIITGRMSNLIENEPAFQRSRSTAFHILRPSRFLNNSNNTQDSSRFGLPPSGKKNKSSFWSVFYKKSSKKVEEDEETEPNQEEKGKENQQEMKKIMMIRSKSCYSDRDQISRQNNGGGDDVRFSTSSNSGCSSKERRSWYFPSPIKVFRQQSLKVIQQRSPLCRG